jgi:hypothetical protein
MALKRAGFSTRVGIPKFNQTFEAPHRDLIVIGAAGKAGSHMGSALKR